MNKLFAYAVCVAVTVALLGCRTATTAKAAAEPAAQPQAKPAGASAGFVAYPPYPGAPRSQDYSVAVDGQPVFVHHFPTYNGSGFMDYVHFAFTGKVTVTITRNSGKVSTCDVRPLAYGIAPRKSGKTVTFELDRPRYLIVFINEPASFASNGLVFFAEAPEENPPKPGDANVVDVTSYGIDPTGKTVETAKINQAVADVAAKPGGGVLFFPRGGVYLTGTVMMKSNVTLYVEAGALIKGSANTADYPPAPLASGSGAHMGCLFWFNDVANARLMGRGTIDANGYPELHGGKRNIQSYRLDHCRDIVFQDLILRRSCYWTINLFDCDGFTSRRIKILNRKKDYCDDGYDIDVSRHVRIEDGFALVTDEPFAIKGTSRASFQPIEDIVVKGFVAYGYDDGLAIGYHGESRYKFVKDVRFEDVHFVSAWKSYAIWIAFTPNPPTGYSEHIDRPLENFRFVNCTFEEGGAVYISGGVAPLTGFSFEGCRIYNQLRRSTISGTGFGPVSFKDLRIEGAAIGSVEDLRKAGMDISVPAKFEP